MCNLGEIIRDFTPNARQLLALFPPLGYAARKCNHKCSAFCCAVRPQELPHGKAQKDPTPQGHHTKGLS
jgi:hypothetical protein